MIIIINSSSSSSSSSIIITTDIIITLTLTTTITTILILITLIPPRRRFDSILGIYLGEGTEIRSKRHVAKLKVSTPESAEEARGDGHHRRVVM
jgi:hypothetical protein